MTQVRKAVFPAAGLGTRFLPATKAMPKEMLPLVDKPLIQYAVEEACSAGIRDLVVVTGRGKSAIEEHFDINFELEYTLRKRGKNALADEVHRIANLTTIAFVRQHQALGLGHAVLQTRSLVEKEPFAVLLADDVVIADPSCLQQLLEVHREVGGSVVALMEVPQDRVSSYGIVWGETVAGLDAKWPVLKLHGLVEKPLPEQAPSNRAVIGRYVLDVAVFSELEKTAPDKNGEIQLTDALHRLAKNQTVHGVLFSGRRFDAGNKLDFLKAAIEIALHREDLGTELRCYIKDLAAMSDEISFTHRS